MVATEGSAGGTTAVRYVSVNLTTDTSTIYLTANATAAVKVAWHVFGRQSRRDGLSFPDLAASWSNRAVCLSPSLPDAVIVTSIRRLHRDKVRGNVRGND